MSIAHASRHFMLRTRAFAGFGAWFFIVFSLMHLAWVVSVKWSSPGGLTTLYQTTVGDETFRAWGLAYAGVFGLLVALVQSSLVSAAAAGSLLRNPRIKRWSHAILVGWAALWMLGLVRLAAIDQAIDSIAAAALAMLLFGCTTIRAFVPRAGLRPSPPPAPPGDVFTIDAPALSEPGGDDDVSMDQTASMATAFDQVRAWVAGTQPNARRLVVQGRTQLDAGISRARRAVASASRRLADRAAPVDSARDTAGRS